MARPSVCCTSCNATLSNLDEYINAGAPDPRCQQCFSSYCQGVLDTTDELLRDLGEVPDSDKIRKLTKSLTSIISTFYTNATPAKRLVEIVNIAETCLAGLSPEGDGNGAN